MGRDRVDGIATRYGLDGPGIEYRWGRDFPHPSRPTPGTHPAPCTMGTGSFPEVKRPGRGTDHPPPSKRRGHERVGLYLYSPSEPQWPVMGRNFIYLSHIYYYYYYYYYENIITNGLYKRKIFRLKAHYYYY